jgi:hypothetical protein
MTAQTTTSTAATRYKQWKAVLTFDHLSNHVNADTLVVPRGDDKSLMQYNNLINTSTNHSKVSAATKAYCTRRQARNREVLFQMQVNRLRITEWVTTKRRTEDLRKK